MRIVIADDSVLLREGLQLLLTEAGHDVVAAVGDGPALVEAGLSHRPDLCVVDVRMPPSHTDEGLRAVVEMRREWPDARVMVLSQYVELSYAEDLLADGRGGMGYLLKDRVSDVKDFLSAVERVAAGGTVIDPIVVSQLIGRRRDPLAALTPREQEVLALMAEGHSNAGDRRGDDGDRGSGGEVLGPRLHQAGPARPTRADTAGCSPCCAGCNAADTQRLPARPAQGLVSRRPHGQAGPMPTPTTVVLFGATGDLAQRKLLPGLLHLFQSGLLNEVQVVGTSLDDHDRDSFVEFARKAVAEYGGEGPDPEGWDEFSKRLRWAPGERRGRGAPRRPSPRPRRSSAPTSCAGCTT